MTEEERRRKLAELEARRRSGLQTYQQLSGVKRDVRAITGPNQAVARDAVDKALTGQIPDELYVLPLPGVPRPLPADVLKRRDEVALRTGARANPVQGELSRDIEGALKQRGGVETVAGDQRLVVTPGTDSTAMAGRTEFPPVVEHIKAYVAGEPGQAGFTGVFGNALDAFPRSVATALLHVKDLDQGKPLRLEKIPSDIGAAVANTSGGTGKVGEGGNVASRGSGGGDWLRSHFRDVQEGRVTLKRDGKPIPFEEATGRDWFGVLSHGLEPFWKYGWLPAKTAVSTASGAAENALSSVMNNVSDPDAPGGMDVLDAITGAPRDYRGEVDQLRQEFLDRPLKDIDINDPRFFDVMGTVMTIPLPAGPGITKMAGAGL
jgi:hypothetical protein